jgi:DNA-binding NarL/FixJ family response regulator
MQIDYLGQSTVNVDIREQSCRGQTHARRQSSDSPADAQLEPIHRRRGHNLPYRTGITPATGGAVLMGEVAVPDEPNASAHHEDQGRVRDPKLLIVDDCKLFRESLMMVFAEKGCVKTSVAWDLPTLFTALTENALDVVLINLDTRDSGMLLQVIFEISPNMKVIVLGVSEDDEAGIVACAEAGVAGYHLRTEALDELLALIRRVADGESWCSARVSAILLRRLSSLAQERTPAVKEVVLTAREAQILRMLEMGLSNRDIAAESCIALHTVKNHVHSLLTKLGVGTRTEAAARFRSARFMHQGPEN